MTVRGRIFGALAALFVVPALLLAATGLAVRGFNGADDGFDGRGWVPAAVATALMELVADEPDRILDARERQRLVEGYEWLSIRLVDPPPRNTLATGSSARNDRSAHGTVVVPIRLSDGSMVGVAIGPDHGRRDGGRSRGPVVALSAVAVLVLVTSLISWRVSRAIVGPLVRLTGWAETLGAGELDVSLRPDGDEEVRRVMVALEEMRGRLRESIRRQTAEERSRIELIAALSHDLRTPVTTIKGYTEGLRDGIPQTDADRDRYLATIHEKALLLERLIGDLFAYARISSGATVLRTEPIDCRTLIAEIGEEVFGRQPEISGDAVVVADRAHISRVVTNLLENALRYAPAALPRIRLEPARSGVRITVADDGPGVAEPDRSRLFDAGFRADRARNVRSPGTGLGLAIVRQLVVAHGGTAAASATHPDGRGLTISVEIPGDAR